jgi:hypothetical protein
MDNGKNLWPLLVVLLFGVIGFLVAYRYFTDRNTLSVPPLDKEGELVYVR